MAAPLPPRGSHRQHREWPSVVHDVYFAAPTIRWQGSGMCSWTVGPNLCMISDGKESDSTWRKQRAVLLSLSSCRASCCVRPFGTQPQDDFSVLKPKAYAPLYAHTHTHTLSLSLSSPCQISIPISIPIPTRSTFPLCSRRARDTSQFLASMSMCPSPPSAEDSVPSMASNRQRSTVGPGP